MLAKLRVFFCGGTESHESPVWIHQSQIHTQSNGNWWWSGWTLMVLLTKMCRERERGEKRVMVNHEIEGVGDKISPSNMEFSLYNPQIHNPSDKTLSFYIPVQPTRLILFIYFSVEKHGTTMVMGKLLWIGFCWIAADV